jgi:hypothetical protein
LHIIIPTTKSSAGAKAAGLGNFYPMMIQDCYPAEMQPFCFGFKKWNQNVYSYNKNFVLTIEERQKIGSLER